MKFKKLGILGVLGFVGTALFSPSAFAMSDSEQMEKYGGVLYNEAEFLAKYDNVLSKDKLVAIDYNTYGSYLNTAEVTDTCHYHLNMDDLSDTFKNSSPFKGKIHVTRFGMEGVLVNGSAKCLPYSQKSPNNNIKDIGYIQNGKVYDRRTHTEFGDYGYPFISFQYDDYSKYVGKASFPDMLMFGATMPYFDSDREGILNVLTVSNSKVGIPTIPVLENGLIKNYGLGTDLTIPTVKFKEPLPVDITYGYNLYADVKELETLHTMANMYTEEFKNFDTPYKVAYNPAMLKQWVYVENGVPVSKNPYIKDQINKTATKPMKFTDGRNLIHTGLYDRFNDIYKHYASTEISTLGFHGLVDGDSDFNFHPNTPIKRGEFVSMLVRGADKKVIGKGTGKVFNDVNSSTPYVDEIEQAYKLGITNVTDGYFRPNDTITRQQMTAMLMRFYHVVSDSTIDTSNVKQFIDHDKIADYAKDTVYEANALGITQGSNGYFNPNNNATKAQGAIMVYRMFNMMGIFTH